jgi:hypothetical protein
MNKEGMNELKKLFEQKQKKEIKEDKKKKEKPEKLKKENTKPDTFSQRSLTFVTNELESVRNNLVKNINKNDKNEKASNNNTNKQAENELDKIKNRLLVRNSVNFSTSLDIKEFNNGGVKNPIQNFNKTVNDNKDNKKETNSSKNIISNLNKDNNKNGSNKDEKNEAKNVKNNATNINNKENKNVISKSRADTVIDPKTINAVIKDNGKMDIKSLIKTNNKTINENEKKVFEKSFDRFVSLQILLKKESSLKELCK